VGDGGGRDVDRSTRGGLVKVMSGLDARFLYSETRSAHMHTMKVVVVDIAGRTEPLSTDLLMSVVQDRLRRMPVLRRRVVPAPYGLGNPVVVDDPDFELASHIRQVTALAPGDQRELDRVVATIAGTALPRDRPLWELTVVDGLEEGRLAFVMKIHHALADGVAAVAMLQNAFVVDESDAVVEEYAPRPLPTQRELYRATATGAARAVRTVPRVVSRTVSGTRHARVVRQTITAPISRPFEGPRTPFNVALTEDRTFSGLAIPLELLTDAKNTTGVTLNATFLALCGGGIRRYLTRMRALPEHTLVASVPMATRTDRHRLGGNHVDNLFLPIRSDIADPFERARSIHDSAVAARAVREEFGPDLFEWRSGLVPAGLHGLVPRVWGATGLASRLRPPLNLIASCVRGPRHRLEVDGGVVTSLFSSGPILEGIGLNITAWSYVDTMYVSVLGCSASLPDPWLLTADLEDEAESWSSSL